MKRLLITGVSGLLGINAALRLHNEYEIFGIAHTKGIEKVPFVILRHNLCDEGIIQKVLDKVQPDYIIHCAALADVDICEKYPQKAFEVNSNLPRMIAQETYKSGCKLVHISTDAVFDGVKGNYAESDTPNPINIYGKSKLKSENYVLEYNSDAIIARVNFFGWSLSGRRSLGEFFYNSFASNKNFYGFHDAFFSPIEVTYLVDILKQMLRSKAKGLYNVVGSQAISKYDFGLLIAKSFSFDESLLKKVSADNGGMDTRRAKNLSLDVSKLTKDIDCFIPTPKQSIDKFKDLSRENWLEGLVLRTLSS